MQIQWTDYGKVKYIDTLIQDTPSVIFTKLTFRYDATGNRLEKEYVLHYKDIYLRDPQGNVMAVYRIRKDSLYLYEIPLYGSSRLGVIKENKLLMTQPTQNNTGVMSLPIPVNIAQSKNTPKPVVYTMGKKHYESTDWLGNVRVTYTDKKSWQQNKFALKVSSSQDYYPFGSVMEGRKYNLTAYRYAFNTQERMPELNESHYTALYWEYDGRLARRWNRDPKPSVGESEYAVNKNNPIQYNDPNGDCPWCLAILGEMVAGAAISGAIEAGIQLYDIATTDKKLSDFNWQQVGEAAVVGAVTGPMFSWAGRAASPYLKRITAGAVTQTVSKGAQQVLKYAGYGGDVKAVAGRTMKVLGKFEGGIDVLKVQAEKMGMLKQIDEMKAQMTEGVEMLNVPSHSWKEAGKEAFKKYNVPFLEEAWNKGEILRFVTDPVKYKKEFGYAKTFGQEIEWLESKLGKKIEEVIDPKSGTIDLSKYNKLQGK